MRSILLVSEFFPPDPGGIQRSLDLLGPAWGDRVEVITPVRQKKYPGLQRSLFSGRLRPRWLWLLREFWRRARDGRRLIVFGHYSAAVMAAWLLRPWGVQYVVLTHGNDVLIEQQRWVKTFLGAHLRAAEWVGVNSSWLTDTIAHHGVPQYKIIRTHPAVADDELMSGLSHHNHQLIITIARLVPRKNIGMVLRAVAIVLKRLPTVQYHIVGDGPERDHLQQLIKQLGIQHNVVWHGQTNETTRRDLLRRANIFILTPIIRDKGSDVEGLGAVYLEAMAAGLPIIAANTGGVSDAVQSNVNGIFVEPNDPTEIATAIESLLGNPEKHHLYGQAGRALAEREFLASVRSGRAKHFIHGWTDDEQPKISIIIPAFNSARTIDQTLQAVWQQRWKNLEVIVVDDGSTDNLDEVLRPHRDRVTLIQQANAGAPAARNRGAAEATGRWWLFLDADTVLQPDALTTMASVLEAHPEAAYAYSDFRFGAKKFQLQEFSGNRLRQMNYIHTSSLLRPAAWPGFDPGLKRFQDWDLWLTMLANGHRGIWIPRELFRISDTGMMSRWLPSIIYRLPLIGRGIGNTNIRKYRAAEAVIRAKHQL